MGLFKSFFTWWDGPTWGTRLFTRRHGEEVGQDAQGNRYYQTADGKRRWVIFAGENEASRVAAEWHGWLHKTTNILPAASDIPIRAWEQPHRSNPTGSDDAYLRAGALPAGGRRERATGDYEAWRPE